MEGGRGSVDFVAGWTELKGRQTEKTGEALFVGSDEAQLRSRGNLQGG